MKSVLFCCAALGLTALAGTVIAQDGEVGSPKAVPIPWDLGQWDGGQVMASDPAEGSVVLGGRRLAGKPPASRAFVAKHSAAGREVWRHDAGTLFGALTSLDGRYMLASTVHGVSVDPLTSEIHAVGEALIGWQDSDCAAGMATARGAFVLRLATDGTLLHDAYLGRRPQGPPVIGQPKAGCSPQQWIAWAGHHVTVESNGDVVVTGWRHGTSATSPADVFVQRLRPDLSTAERPVIFGAGPELSTLAKSTCSLDPGDVLSVGPLGPTVMDPPNLGESLLAQPDDCSLRITYGGGNDYGLVVELHQLTPIPPTRDVHVKAQYLGNGTGEPQLELLAKRAGTDDYDLIDTLDADLSGKIDKVVTIQNLLFYYQSSSSSLVLHVRARFGLGFFNGDLPCKDDYSVDRVE